MFPAISVFGRNVSTYSLVAILGIAVAVLYVWLRIRRRTDIDKIQIVNVPAIAFIGAFIGAHILYGITHLDKQWWCITHLSYVFESWESVSFYFIDIFGGMVFYGGLIGGIIAGAIYCKIMKLDMMFYADLFAPAFPLFHAFGRIGCFLGGCCYGIECSWGFSYPNETITRLPVQLIESVGDIMIFVVLAVLANKKLRKGTLFLLYLIMYSVLRMVTEFFRGDEIRGIVFGVSTSQWISGILFVVSVIILYRLYRKKTVVTENI